jgi:hypothetical protein
MSARSNEPTPVLTADAPERFSRSRLAQPSARRRCTAHSSRRRALDRPVLRLRRSSADGAAIRAAFGGSVTGWEKVIGVTPNCHLTSRQA